MPGKRKTAPSTPRVRRHRLKKEIERLREGRHGKWNLALWALQTYFSEHDLPVTTFIRALDLHTAEVSDSNIKISVFIPSEAEFLKSLNDPDIEIATVRLDQDVVIVRPKFLKDEIL